MKYRINKVPLKDNDVVYYLATSIRDGKRVSTKNIKSLGKKTDLEKAGIDIENHFAEILESYNSEKEKISLTFDKSRDVGEKETGIFFAGDIFFRNIFNEIKLEETLNAIQKKEKFRYPLADVVFFLICQRILEPDSKLGMYQSALDKDVFAPSFKIDDVYRTMDIMNKYRKNILKCCYDNTPKGIVRDKRILYFDCTKTYFESEIEDELRAKGKGKRNELEPLVSVGLAMDASGIPLTFNIFKGSANEQNHLIPLENEIIEDFRQAQFVMITDAGLSSVENRCFNSIAKRKYITTLPVRKMSEEKINMYITSTKVPWLTTAEQAITPAELFDSYNALTKALDEAIKVNNETRIEKLTKQINAAVNTIVYRRFKVLADKKPKKYRANDKDEFLDEDFLVSFSLKYALRQRKTREKLIERAKALLGKPGKMNAKGINDPKQYISKLDYDPQTGEKITDVAYYIDEELIKKQMKLDGYYCVATNLLEDENETIITAMRYRWFIEDSFKIMKQHFNFRPVNHWRQDRIKTHFFSCFLSLLFYRYLQKLCHQSNYETLKTITDENLLSVIKSYNLSKIKKDFFVPAFSRTSTIKELEELFAVNLSKEIMTIVDIKREFNKKT